MAIAAWLLQRVGHGDLFIPMVLLMLGMLLAIYVRLDVIGRRLDAIVQVLNEHGILK